MKILTLSFDDCEIYDRRLCDMLRAHGLRATFFLISGLLGQRVPFHRYGTDTVVQRVSPEEIPLTYRDMEVASHTRFHRFEDQDLEEAVSASVSELTGLCGYAVEGFAYPGGQYTPQQAARLKGTGVVYARGACGSHSFAVPEDWYQWQPTCHYADPELPALIDAFLGLPDSCDAIFHIFGHSYEMTDPDAGRDWAYLEDVFRRLAHQPGVRYATNLEAFYLMTNKTNGRY